MKQVPEDTDKEAKVPDEETQLANLRKELIGNAAFAACRGQTHKLFRETVEKAPSPTQFCKNWDEMAGHMRIMGNLLAQYRRDGWMIAYRELAAALQSKHVIIGETVPLEETSPMTLVMFDPERTFLMLRWLISSHWSRLDDHFTPGRPESDELTKELLARFPSLEQLTTARLARFQYPGSDLCAAYRKDVLNERWQIPNTWKRLEIDISQYSSHVELHQQTFAFLAVGIEQGEVLRAFDRSSEQSMIGTWQINYPRSLLGCMPGNHLEIGFHQEAEHASHSVRYPAFSSKGISHGMGALILDVECEEYQRPVDGRMPRDGKFRIVLNS